MTVLDDRDLRAKAYARTLYDEAFDAHCVAEQIAFFHADKEAAWDHRDALRLVLQRGDEELNCAGYFEEVS
jgi:hypothetical protein